MTEDQEHAIVRDWLDTIGVVWTHVPGGSAVLGSGHSRLRRGAQLKRQGVKPGVPDFLVFTPPPRGSYGAALELKAGKGRLTPAQDEWLRSLEACGWSATVAWGADKAIEWFKALGYGEGS